MSTSTALTRLPNNNRTLVQHSPGRSQLEANSDTFLLNDANYMAPSTAVPDEDSIEKLERRALAAKRGCNVQEETDPALCAKAELVRQLASPGVK